MKKTKRKLHLDRSIIRIMNGDRLDRVAGGRDSPVTTSTITIITWECPGVTDTTCAR